MSRQMLDHRGLEFQQLGRRVLSGIKGIFKTQNHVIIYPSSGTGAWEAALSNTLSPGDKVLMCETGQFAVLWAAMAARLGLAPEVTPTDWRIGADANLIEKALRADKAHKIKAVCVVHNETSTGCVSRLDEVRKAYETIMPINSNLCIMQCTSGYPPAHEELNLKVIETFEREFPDIIIGFSSHDSGIAMPLVGYMLGARVFEKHFTLNRTWKGTDHAASNPSTVRKAENSTR